MDKQNEDDTRSAVEKEECFVIKINQSDDVEEEKMENKSNIELHENLSDEDYFLECARYNDIEELDHFIKQGFNINSTDNRKNTALRILQ